MTRSSCASLEEDEEEEEEEESMVSVEHRRRSLVRCRDPPESRGRGCGVGGLGRSDAAGHMLSMGVIWCVDSHLRAAASRFEMRSQTRLMLEHPCRRPRRISITLCSVCKGSMDIFKSRA